jgi:hypothetical protein
MAKMHALQAKSARLKSPHLGSRPIQQPVLVVQLGGKGNRLVPERVDATQDPTIEFPVTAMKTTVPMLA